MRRLAALALLLTALAHASAADPPEEPPDEAASASADRPRRVPEPPRDPLDLAVQWLVPRWIGDERLYLFDVTAEREGPLVRLRGVAEHRAHVRRLEQMLRRQGLDVKDEVAIAPGPDLAGKAGVVLAPRVALLGRIGEPRSIETEALLGEVVFPLRYDAADPAWLQVRGGDGYIGWLPTEAVRLIDAAEAGARDRAPRFRIERPAVVAGTVLPPGAVLPVAPSADAASDAATVAVRLPDGATHAIEAALGRVLTAGPDERVERVIAEAQARRGVRYVWGGRGEQGVDCSSLVQLGFASVGVHLPRDSDQQAIVGRVVATASCRTMLRRGDLLFFAGGRRGIGHVALYLGDGAYIEAARDGVAEGSLDPADPRYDAERDRALLLARRVFE